MITEEQFISLLVAHEAELRGMARALMLRPEEADDLMQEATLAMWRKFDTLQCEEAFRRWAYSYLRLTALNLRRKKRRSPLVFSDEMLDCLCEEWERHADLADAKRQALASCLGELPPRQRNLLAMYYSSPKTTAVELGERMNRTVEGIYKALGRIRSALRACIEEKLAQGGFAP